MRMLHRPLLIALTAASFGAGCDKKPETQAAPTAAPSAPAPTPTEPAPTPSAPAPTPTEPGPALEPVLNTPDPHEVFVVAQFDDGRKITSDQVETAVAPLRNNGLTFPILAETVEDMVDDVLLVAEARASNFDTKETDDRAIAQAWAKVSFGSKGQAAVTDADLERWFSDRRGVARIWIRAEHQANELRQNLMDSFANAPDKRRDLFLELKRKVGGRHDPTPDGVLVDIEGKGELGEALVPVEIAQAVFALEKDFEVSQPIAVKNGFALVQRVGARPATPLSKVPAHEIDAAREKLAIKRTNQLAQEHTARLRADHKVTIDEAAVARLGLKLGLGHGRHGKIPLGVRKMQLERLRHNINGLQEVRDPSLIPPGVPAAERAKYEAVREKMQRRPTKTESTP